MTLHGLILAVALAAAALAVWLDARFDTGPRTITKCFVHTAGAMLLLKFVPVLLRVVVAGSDSPQRKTFAILTVLLPALIYTWLATIWLLKLVQRAAHLR